MAGARNHGDLCAQHAPFVVVTGFIVVPEAVAPTGDHEVVVAVKPQLDWALQPGSGDRRDARKDRRLGLLAAKPAAHAPAFDMHIVGVQLQGMRDQMLHFARVLRRAVQVQAAAFGRNRVTDLAFKVELFLAADFKRAFEAMRRLGNRRLGTAICFAHQVHGRQHILAFGVRLLGREHWRFGGDGQHFPGLCSSAAGGFARAGDHREHRLAQVADVAVTQNRVVVNDGAAIVGPRNVAGRHHQHHAGQCANGVQRHAGQLATRHRRQAQRAVQRAGEFGNVVDVGGFTGHVQVGRFVRATDADASATTLGIGFGALVDSRCGVLAVIGKGFGGLQQQGIDGFVHLRLPCFGLEQWQRRALDAPPHAASR